MNGLNLTWEEAVLHVLRDHYPSEVSLQTVYFEVEKYRKLVDEDLEVTRYGEPRYHHVVRARLAHLKKKGYAERLGTGIYVLKE